VAVLALLVGCTTRNEPISDVIPPLVSETPVAAPQQNEQTLRVTILDGHFVSTLYEEMPGATRMRWSLRVARMYSKSTNRFHAAGCGRRADSRQRPARRG
jgi:hypothetical protein